MQTLRNRLTHQEIELQSPLKNMIFHFMASKTNGLFAERDPLH